MLFGDESANQNLGEESHPGEVLAQAIVQEPGQFVAFLDDGGLKVLIHTHSIGIEGESGAMILRTAREENAD